jgi:nicotinamide phosphoribosyltransferase
MNLSPLTRSALQAVTRIDGYKLDHRRQYPKNTTRVYSNWTPRGTRVEGQKKVVALGTPFLVQKYLVEDFEPFFAANIDEVCAAYEARVNGYLGPNSIGSDHIRALHALGYLPLEIRALPEGTHVPLRIPMVTVENTHDDFAWLVNYFETLISSVLWMPSTSATSALRVREVLEDGARLTGSPLGFVDWQGHDFSFRGMLLPEGAALSGVGHLLFFTGTDTLPAIDLIEQYYGVPEGYLIAGSVAATEHSVMCAGGKEDERATFERLLELYPEGIVSVVSDTWDLWKVLTEILPSLKDRIMARNGKLVIRPDSGNPADIVCGDPNAPEGSPARKGVIELLWETFGGTKTDLGFKVLDSHIGCIYGDAITRDRAKEIIERLAAKGFASCNMVFGVGSFTYQFVTRDTYSFAMKATWAMVDGEGRDLFKSPITDKGEKKSAKGRLAVLRDENGELYLVEGATPEQEAASLLRVVWRNGQFLVRETFDVIRARAQSER